MSSNLKNAAMPRRPRLLLLGDSLIDWGDWQRRLPRYRVSSSGIPGERSEELLTRLEHVLPSEAPDLVLLMTGTNNLLMGDDDFPEIIEELVVRLSAATSPDRLILTSLLPYRIPGSTAAVRTANDRLRTIAGRRGCRYFDLHLAFAAGDALFSFDGVHLSEAGYRLWASEMLAVLDDLVAKAAD